MNNTKIYGPSDITPSTPLHPGEILRDELMARGISQHKFALLIDASYSVINEIINGKRPITTEIALKIEATTSTNAQSWINMQSAYNMHIARQDSRLSAILEQIRKSAAVF